MGARVDQALFLGTHLTRKNLHIYKVVLHTVWHTVWLDHPALN